MSNGMIQRQKGNSMIEVVVTILVISLGLLGLAALQITAMRYQRISSQRSEATQSVHDLGERIRANRLGVMSGHYLHTTAYATTVSNQSAIPTCAKEKCTSKEIAQIDLAQWLQNLNRRLHGGAGYVESTAVGGYDVTIMWKEQSSKLATQELDPACPTNPMLAPGLGVRCYVVRVAP